MEKSSYQSWLETYVKTTEGTSNRRIKITSMVLQAHSIVGGFLIIFLTLAIKFELEKWATGLIWVTASMIMLFTSVFLFFNSCISKKINEEKFKLLIKKEKEIWKSSLYEQEYFKLQKQKSRRLSRIDTGLGCIFAIFDILMMIVGLVIIITHN